MDKNEIIEDLSTWAAATRNAESVVRHNSEGRDRAIRLAIFQKIPVATIVQATGLTRGRIYQIRDQTRDAV